MERNSFVKIGINIIEIISNLEFLKGFKVDLSYNRIEINYNTETKYLENISKKFKNIESIDFRKSDNT